MYVVEKGDGLWAIAQKLTGSGARMSELVAANRDKSPLPEKNIWVGERLRLPASWIKTPAANVPAPAVQPPAPATAGTYTVVAGDGLDLIAKKLINAPARGVELVAANPDKVPAPNVNIWVGEVLKLPASWAQLLPAPQPIAPYVGPSPAPPKPSILKPLPIVPVEPLAADTVRGIEHAKTILAAWASTDGAGPGAGELRDRPRLACAGLDRPRRGRARRILRILGRERRKIGRVGNPRPGAS